MASRPQNFSRFNVRVGPQILPRGNLGADTYVRATTKDTRAALHQITKTINEIIRKAKTETPAVLLLALEPIFHQSLIYCPVDTGDLRNSGNIDVETHGDKVKAEITYGDAIVWYAPLVHEILHYFHEPPTRAKFLQAAMEEGVAELPDRLKSLYQELLGLSQ